MKWADNRLPAWGVLDIGAYWDKLRCSAGLKQPCNFMHKSICFSLILGNLFHSATGSLPPPKWHTTLLLLVIMSYFPIHNIIFTCLSIVHTTCIEIFKEEDLVVAGCLASGRSRGIEYMRAFVAVSTQDRKKDRKSNHPHLGVVLT